MKRANPVGLVTARAAVSPPHTGTAPRGAGSVTHRLHAHFSSDGLVRTLSTHCTFTKRTFLLELDRGGTAISTRDNSCACEISEWRRVKHTDRTEGSWQRHKENAALKDKVLQDYSRVHHLSLERKETDACWAQCKTSSEGRAQG